MTVRILSVLAMCLFVSTAPAQMTNSFPLWPDGAPGALGNQPKGIPTLTVFLPDTTNACAAMIVCAGGAYGHLADHEGSLYAKWLNAHGIAAFVLKYRLGPQYNQPPMLQAPSRGLATVRAAA